MRLSSSLLRNSTAALVLTLSLSVPTLAGTDTSAKASAGVVDISAVQIDNFGRVDSHYYRGAQPQGRDYADLVALGVKTVINLTSDDADAGEQAMVEGAGMKYVQIPMTTRTAPTSAQLAKFLKIVNDPAQQPVYVHCVGGRHRTGVMTAVYRMTGDAHLTSDQAFAEMKQFKFGADFLHPEFKRFVYAYRPDVEPATPTLAANDVATVAR
jgi:tyrosine-protein phosphatase SIW14